MDDCDLRSAIEPCYSPYLLPRVVKMSASPSRMNLRTVATAVQSNRWVQSADEKHS